MLESMEGGELFDQQDGGRRKVMEIRKEGGKRDETEINQREVVCLHLWEENVRAMEGGCSLRSMEGGLLIDQREEGGLLIDQEGGGWRMR